MTSHYLFIKCSSTAAEPWRRENVHSSTRSIEVNKGFNGSQIDSDSRRRWCNKSIELFSSHCPLEFDLVSLFFSVAPLLTLTLCRMKKRIVVRRTDGSRWWSPLGNVKIEIDRERERKEATVLLRHFSLSSSSLSIRMRIWHSYRYRHSLLLIRCDEGTREQKKKKKKRKQFSFS